MANQTAEQAGLSALAYLAAYLLQKAANKETKFAETKTALMQLGLQTVITVAQEKLDQTSTAATTDTKSAQ